MGFRVLWQKKSLIGVPLRTSWAIVTGNRFRFWVSITKVITSLTSHGNRKSIPQGALEVHSEKPRYKGIRLFLGVQLVISRRVLRDGECSSPFEKRGLEDLEDWSLPFVRGLLFEKGKRSEEEAKGWGRNAQDVHPFRIVTLHYTSW